MKPLIGLVPFLKANGVAVDEADLKIHLACWNGKEDPINGYYAGVFKEWQEEQTRKNFECAQVLSLIDIGPGEWLFVGVYRVTKPAKRHPRRPQIFVYGTEALAGQDHLIGRIKVAHKRSRASYVWHKPPVTLPIIEVMREKQVMGDFPGYNKVTVSHQELRTIIGQRIASWHGALANIKGVYLISDKVTGGQYVGKASGCDGIWSRWTSYAKNGHGGNVELKKLLRQKGEGHMANLQYSVLEIADTHASDADILQRESYWVRALGSRVHGLNGK
jgi:hypothetical protein